MQGIGNATMLLGRVLLSLLFLIGGTIKLLGASARQAMFVKQGLPMVEAIKLCRPRRAWLVPRCRFVVEIIMPHRIPHNVEHK